MGRLRGKMKLWTFLVVFGFFGCGRMEDFPSLITANASIGKIYIIFEEFGQQSRSPSAGWQVSHTLRYPACSIAHVVFASGT